MKGVAWLLFILTALPCASHEVRPALIQITERDANHYDILWKQPTMGEVAVHLAPQISGGLLGTPPNRTETTSSFQIYRWINVDAGSQGLEGRSLFIEGLEQTITDVLVVITLRDGTTIQQILRPNNPNLALHLRQVSASVPEFLILGVRHILTGPDHLLFVLALLLIVRNRAQLIKTITAFTLAHSLTLAAATLGEITVSTPVLNTLIALSILFIALEAIRAECGGTSLTIRYPWLVAFVFGLLHGLGFASGISPMGLQKGALLAALVLFNIGVEAGQLAFIALLLALKRSSRLMKIEWPRTVQLAPAYVIGTLGAFWTVEYGVLLWEGV